MLTRVSSGQRAAGRIGRGVEDGAGQGGGLLRTGHDRGRHHGSHPGAARPPPPGRASVSSMTRVAAYGDQSRATPTTETSWPSSAIMRSAGPLRAWPAMIGDTATTRFRRARHRRADAAGLQHRPDGHDRIRRADHQPFGPGDGIQDTRGSRGRSHSRPGGSPVPERRGGGPRSTPGTRLLARCRPARRSPPGSRPRSSDMGRIRTSTPHLAEISAVTSERVAPSASRVVR